MTNRVLDQRYELLERVGGGGMADVYKAQDRLLDRPVAVKILHAQFQSDEEAGGGPPLPSEHRQHL